MLKRVLTLFTLLSVQVAFPATKTENLVLITSDGLRWQEVFTGAESDLISPENHVRDTNALRARFWRETPEQRREALMPFFWNVIARKGQLYGNANKGSQAVVTNGKKFTYPGFNEIFTGSPDDRINKNEKRNNPNVTVFEWLHNKPAFTGKIAAFVNWDVHPYILNVSRSGIPAWSGYETNLVAAPGSRLQLIQQIQKDTTPVWGDMSFDSFYFHAAREYFQEKKPRVMWIAFSETDEWAHEGYYNHYLEAAHNVGGYIRRLWETMQSLPQYRDKTTFLITCDHGRGDGADWRNHGAAVAGAEKVWLAALGPDTPPLGERTNIAQVTHSQIAATIAALLGEDFHAAMPKSGPPIHDVLGKGK